MKESFFTMFAAAFIWAGFICAISFMEAWLKFRAPGVTLPVGLSIGKVVFRALNRMEWIFAIIILVAIILTWSQAGMWGKVWYGLALVVLIVQTFWLLPALDLRADAFINGGTPGPSTLHWYFVAGEIIKVAALFFLGGNIFKMIYTLNQLNIKT